jgi:signal peptidase II
MAASGEAPRASSGPAVPISAGETTRARGRTWRRFVAVALIVALDLATKSAVFGWLAAQSDAGALTPDVHGHGRIVLIDDWLGLMKSCNAGAAFGMLTEFPHVLVWGRLAACLLLLWLLLRADKTARASFVANVLVVAGALGNLADNLGLGCQQDGHPYGLVRDFIDVWFHAPAWGWDWHFDTFNVADSCITVGAILWILAGLFEKPARRAPTSAAEAPAV